MSNKVLKRSEEIEYNSNPFTLSFKGFGLFANYAKNILIIIIVISSLGYLLNILSYIPDTSNNSDITQVSQTNSVSSSGDPVNVATILLIVLGVSGLIVLMFVTGLLISALYKGFVAAGTVSAMNKKAISAGEAFSQTTEKLGVLFKAEIITTLKIIGGYILFIIPGVRAQLRYQSTPFIIMSEKEITASSAVAKSKDLYTKHLMEAFGISTVGAIIPFIGPAIMASGMTLSVNQLTAYKDLNKETPKTHWLNYIGLILGLLFFLGMISIVLLALVFLNATTS